MPNTQFGLLQVLATYDDGSCGVETNETNPTKTKTTAKTGSEYLDFALQLTNPMVKCSCGVDCLCCLVSSPHVHHEGCGLRASWVVAAPRVAPLSAS